MWGSLIHHQPPHSSWVDVWEEIGIDLHTHLKSKMSAVPGTPFASVPRGWVEREFTESQSSDGFPTRRGQGRLLKRGLVTLVARDQCFPLYFSTSRFPFALCVSSSYPRKSLEGNTFISRVISPVFLLIFTLSF